MPIPTSADDFLADLAQRPEADASWESLDLALDVDPTAEVPEADPLAQPESAAVAERCAEEVIVERRTGRVRQAGTVESGPWLDQFRTRCESSLFLLATSVLGLTRLTRGLHRPICQWLTKCPPYRKLYLLPRDHLKTSIARALVIHLHLQPRERNVYFPGCRDMACRARRMLRNDGVGCDAPLHRMDGSAIRVLYAGETSTNAQHQLRWIEARYEGNQLLRNLWPHKTWENARKQSRKWNEAEMQLPRTEDFPEASVETIGVGGAVTGRHYDVLVKDDLISIEAANSPIVMQGAVAWHQSSRALLDDPDEGLEFILGTRWAVGDLYEHIQQNDPSVEVVRRAVVEDGSPIFPEGFRLEAISRLKRELGPLFQLLYMNDAADPELTDFAPGDLREYDLDTRRSMLTFAADERDILLQRRVQPVELRPLDLRGQRLVDVYDQISSRKEFLRGVRA